MKIKVKKYNKVMFEDAPADSSTNAATATTETPTQEQPAESQNTENAQQPAKSNALRNFAKAKFVQGQKSSSLAAQIIMPSACAESFILQKAPLDLRNLMQDIPVVGGEKQQNIRGMIHDPSKTFDHATDFAKTIFGNIEKVKFSEEPKSSKQQNNQNENYIFNEGSYINEGGAEIISGAATIGAKTGVALGVTTDALTAGLGSAFITFLGTAAPAIATLYGSSYMLGYAFSDVKDGGIENDSKLKNSNEDTEDLSDDFSDKNWRSQNTIEAIDEYLTQIGQSVGKVLADITGGKPEKYEAFQEKITNYISASDEQIKEYIDHNSEFLKKIKEDKTKDLEASVSYLKNGVTIQTKVNRILVKALSNNPNSISINDINKINKHIEGLLKNIKSSSARDILEQYENAGNVGNIQQIYTDYKQRNESYIYNDINKLYEAEDDSDDENNETSQENNKNSSEKLKPVDLVPYYKNIKAEFTNVINPMFPLNGGAKTPGVTEAKAQMDRLMKDATERIHTQIDHVCRLSNSGNNSGISDKVRGFLVKHPLKAAALKNMWSRHLNDLERRRDDRLKHMGDYENIDYVTGWAANLCRVVVPEVLARMFTYRYALQLLINNDFYSFDSNMEKAAKEIFDAAGNDYTAMAAYSVVFYLSQYGHLYTENDQPIIIIDNGQNENTNISNENNELFEANALDMSDNNDLGISLNKEANLSNITFLLINLLGYDKFIIEQKNDKDDIFRGIVAVKRCLTDFKGGDVNAFLNDIIEAAGVGGHNILSQEETDEIQKKFEDVKYFQGKDIKSTVDDIKNGKFEFPDGGDQKRSLNYILSHINEIVDMNIGDLKTKVNNAEKVKGKKSVYSKAGTEIRKEFFGVKDKDVKPITDSPDGISINEIINAIQSDDSLDNYSYILGIYTSLHLNKKSGYNIKDNIEEICKLVKNAIFIISSNALNIGIETPDWADKLSVYANIGKTDFGNYIDEIPFDDDTKQVIKDFMNNIDDDTKEQIMNNVIQAFKNEGTITNEITNIITNVPKSEFSKAIKKWLAKTDNTISSYVKNKSIMEILDAINSGSFNKISFKDVADVDKLIASINVVILAVCCKYDQEYSLYHLYYDENLDELFTIIFNQDENKRPLNILKPENNNKSQKNTQNNANNNGQQIEQKKQEAYKKFENLHLAIINPSINNVKHTKIEEMITIFACNENLSKTDFNSKINNTNLTLDDKKAIIDAYNDTSSDWRKSIEKMKVLIDLVMKSK